MITATTSRASSVAHTWGSMYVSSPLTLHDTQVAPASQLKTLKPRIANKNAPPTEAHSCQGAAQVILENPGSSDHVGHTPAVGARRWPWCAGHLMEMLLLLFDHRMSQLLGHRESTRTQEVWEAWTSASAPSHLPPSRDSGVAASR